MSQAPLNGQTSRVASLIILRGSELALTTIPLAVYKKTSFCLETNPAHRASELGHVGVFLHVKYYRILSRKTPSAQLAFVRPLAGVCEDVIR